MVQKLECTVGIPYNNLQMTSFIVFVNIIDENDNNPIFSRSSYHFYIDELAAEFDTQDWFYIVINLSIVFQ